MSLRPIFGLFVILAASAAGASSVSIYEHNGSIVDIQTVGEDTIRGIYSTPRPGLESAGIRPGTVLFEGKYEGNRIVARAFAFKAGCAPVGYEVIGDEGHREIVLRGPSPVRSPRGCDVIRYTVDSPNSVLRFRYSSTHH